MPSFLLSVVVCGGVEGIWESDILSGRNRFRSQPMTTSFSINQKKIKDVATSWKFISLDIYVQLVYLAFWEKNG